MQIILEIKKIKDWEILLPLLKRLEINIIQPSKVVTKPNLENGNKLPLADFWGSIPTLDAKVFDTYLKQTRNEWDRPIF